MNNKGKVKEKSHFLRVGMITVVVLCLFIFFFLVIFMNNKSVETVRQTGEFYMQDMSERISMHFESLIKFRLDQVSALSEASHLSSERNDEELKSQMTQFAKDRGFEYLGFVAPDGSIEMIYGQKLSIVDKPPFLRSMEKGETKVAVGCTDSGEEVVLLGAPDSGYKLSDGSSSLAVVAALPVSYIQETLCLEINSSHVYSFIIRKDGSFVIKTSDVTLNNYFDRVQKRYKGDDISVEQYVQQLKSSMEREEPYSSEMIIEGSPRQIYCVKLEKSEWYLITFMPYGELNRVISSLGRQWLTAAIVGCMAILIFLVIIIAMYSKMTADQLRRIEEARSAAEEARREAENSNKAKSEFLSNISHDIRTPMNAIVGMTEIAISNIDSIDRVGDCLHKITTSSKQLLGLINNVLDMSKIENGKMTLTVEQVSLRELTNSVISIIQPQIKFKNQTFDVRIENITSEVVYCDCVRLNQVIMNLLSNAVKFTPEGGTISFRLDQSASEKGEDYVRVHITVKDSGIGMTDEFLKVIFESFVRADNERVHRTEGTGLGMAITKYIVDAMEGKIEVQSVPNEGSEFNVYFDFERAETENTEMKLPNWNVLVVDDDSMLCESAVSYLCEMGVNAQWTLDGESAIAMVKQQHILNNDYQIVLMDYKLPGIDGIETAKRIHEQLENDVPVLLISAYDWSDIEKETENAGIAGFISKPLFKSTLFHSLKKYVESDNDDSVSDDKISKLLCGHRVLLAEDNDINREIAYELLTQSGLEMDMAENGKICVDKFCSSEIGCYDAILMDIRMPVMNGYEATREIRSLDRDDAKSIPIIAMTADAFAEDVKKCLECGMNAHVSKPIDVRKIFSTLEKYIKN